MATAFRSRLAAPAGTTVNLTALNPPTAGAGPSSLTGRNIKNGSFIDNPGSNGQATVLQTVINASGASQLNLQLTDQVAAVSASLRIRFNALPATIWQVLALSTNRATNPTAAALNIRVTDRFFQAAGTSDANASVYKTGAVTYTSGVWYRVNLWADIDAQVMGYAVYDETRTLVETQTVPSIDLGAVGSTRFANLYAGKVDSSNANTTAQFSELAYQLGEAKDLGPAPSMVVDTPPVVKVLSNMELDSGEMLRPYTRATPTTAGATETPGMSWEILSATDLDGQPYPEAITGLAVLPSGAMFERMDPSVGADLPSAGLHIDGLPVTWDSSTSKWTTTDQSLTAALAKEQELPKRMAQIVAPYLLRTALLRIEATGTDSTGLSAKQQFTLTVFGHDLWRDGLPVVFEYGTGA